MAQLKDVNLLSFGNTINLAGAVYLGEGKAYLVMLPESLGSLTVRPPNKLSHEPHFVEDRSGEAYELEELTLSREDWTTFLRQTDLLETEVLQKAGEDGKLVKAIVRKSQRQISQDVSWQVFRRDGYSCRYCGTNDSPLTVDHLVLWEDGGPSEAPNLLSACKKCNNRRGNSTYEEWLKDDYYLRVSANLTAETRQANQDIVKTLDGIHKLKHKRSSR